MILIFKGIFIWFIVLGCHTLVMAQLWSLSIGWD